MAQFAANLHLRSQVRALLRSRGYEFCDDEHTATSSQRGSAQSVLGLSEVEANIAALRHEQLLLRGIASSSCDHPSQNLCCATVLNNDFWSSTGSDSAQDESLLYRLRHPLCRVHSVCISVYRARYQFGEPIYPPQAVSFEVGTHPSAMHPVPGRYAVRRTDQVQTFVLPSNAPLGRFVRIRLHGKVQRQLEDMLFYLAIKHVAVYGSPASPAAANLWRQQQLARPHTRLPQGTCLAASAWPTCVPGAEQCAEHTHQDHCKASVFDSMVREGQAGTHGVGNLISGLCSRLLGRATQGTAAAGEQHPAARAQDCSRPPMKQAEVHPEGAHAVKGAQEEQALWQWFPGDAFDALGDDDMQ